MWSLVCTVSPMWNKCYNAGAGLRLMLVACSCRIEQVDKDRRVIALCQRETNERAKKRVRLSCLSVAVPKSEGTCRG